MANALFLFETPRCDTVGILPARSHPVRHRRLRGARIVIVRQYQTSRSGLIAQRRVGINLLHEDGPDRKRHGGSLSHTHGVEVDIAVLASYPAATYQLRSEANKPSVTVVVGGTRLGTYLSLQVIAVAQSSCRTLSPPRPSAW